MWYNWEMEYFSKIVHIDADESAQSVIERFLPLEDSDIIFTVPSKSLIFQNISELKLLKQAIDSSGKNIVLVSQDEMGLELAHDLGFKVEREFLELLSPQEQEEDSKKYLAKTHPHPKIIDIISSVPLNKMAVPQKRSLPVDEEMSIFKKPEGREKLPQKKFPTLVAILIFIIISLAVGGVAAATLLPRVTVKIIPRKEIVSLDLPIIAEKAISKADIAQNKIPLQIITVEKEKTLEFSATGKSDAPTKAGGEIIIYNKQSFPQTLIATTRFESADGKIFRTQAAITIPANGSLEVAVVADKIGAEHNIGPSEFTLPGFKGGSKFTLVYGKSETTMQGGSDKAGDAVSLNDIENAKKDIKAQMAKELSDELLKEKRELPQAKNLVFIEQAQTAKIIDEKISAGAGTSAEKFSITMKMSSSAFLFEEKDADELIETNIKAKFAQDKINFGEARKNYNNIKMDLDAGTLNFNIAIERDITPIFDIEELQNMFAGKDGEQIRGYILENSQMEGAEISFWPFWVKKAPENINKIVITY